MVLGLVLIVASFMLYLQFIRPAYFDSQDIKSQQLGKSLFLREEQDAISRVQNLISSYGVQNRVREAISMALPAEEDVGGAIAQLYGLSKNSGLSFHSASISVAGLKAATEDGQPTLQKPVGPINFVLRLSGTYDELKKFLEFLETNIRIFDVQNLSLGSLGTAAGGTGPQEFNYDLLLLTYYQK